MFKKWIGKWQRGGGYTGRHATSVQEVGWQEYSRVQSAASDGSFGGFWMKERIFVETDSDCTCFNENGKQTHRLRTAFYRQRIDTRESSVYYGYILVLVHTHFQRKSFSPAIGASDVSP